MIKTPGGHYFLHHRKMWLSYIIYNLPENVFFVTFHIKTLINNYYSRHLKAHQNYTTYFNNVQHNFSVQHQWKVDTSFLRKLIWQYWDKMLMYSRKILNFILFCINVWRKKELLLLFFCICIVASKVFDDRYVKRLVM